MNDRFRRICLLALFGSAGLYAVAPRNASAATVTFTPSSGDYNTAANWSSSRVPVTAGGFNDQPFISGAKTATISSTGTPLPYSLDVNAGGTLTVTSAGAFNGTTNSTISFGSASGTGTLNLAGTFESNGLPIYLGTVSGGTGVVNQTAGALHAGGNMYIGEGSSAIGNYTMSGGTIDTLASGAQNKTIYIGNVATAQGTLTQSAGTITTGTDLVVGLQGTGVYNLSGTGTLNFAGQVGAGHLYVGKLSGGGNGTVNQTGGTVNANSNSVYGGVIIGSAGTGNYNISGGSLLAPRLFLGNSTGAGTLKVIGSAATITVTYLTAFDGIHDVYTQGANGTLIDDITATSVADNTNSNAASSLIHVNDGGFSGDGIAKLAGILDPEALTFVPKNTTYDILSTASTSSLTDTGLTLAPSDVGMWEIDPIATFGGRNVLQITSLIDIPEPASLGFLGLGAMVIFSRRSRKALVALVRA